MRTQKIIMIDLDADGQRRKYEPVGEYHPRLSELLSDKLAANQSYLGEDWYLLSVVPAGSSFVPGVYISTWEMDDEDDVAVMDSTAEAEAGILGQRVGMAFVDEAFSPHPGVDMLKKLTGNSEYGKRCCGLKHADEDADVAEDGDTSPHIQHGEVIRVNGVRFHLVGFTRDGTGSYVSFLEEDAMHLEEQPWGEEGRRITAPRGGRYGYGSAPRVSYNQPRGYRG